MGTALSSGDVKRAVEAVREGREVPQGPILPRFEPEALAASIEQECGKIRLLHSPRVTLVFDPEDAIELVRFLRTKELVLNVFDTRVLADLVQHECNQVEGIENRKIVIHMNPDGALALARFLRFKSAS
jgi:hypothetical protein